MSTVELIKTNMSRVEAYNWYTFKCRLPKAVLDLLETELERVKLLANIDPDDNLSDEVVAGLCLELIVANSANTPEESVV